MRPTTINHQAGSQRWVDDQSDAIMGMGLSTPAAVELLRRILAPLPLPLPVLTPLASAFLRASSRTPGGGGEERRTKTKTKNLSGCGVHGGREYREPCRDRDGHKALYTEHHSPITRAASSSGELDTHPPA